MNMKWHSRLSVFATLLAASHTVAAAAIDDLKVEVSQQPCEGFNATDKSFIIFANNSNPNQSIDANFKYDSVPAQQHFILFDASLNPITDRFPKFHALRLAPHESARIGCTYTYRAAPQPPGPFSVPIVIVKQSAAYVDANATEAPPEDARFFAAFLLQGGINECAAGAKPPGLFYLVNLHPYARLSASMNLLDEHGTRVGVLTPNLSPLSVTRVGCSNGVSKPGPITGATLEVSARVAASLPAAPPPEAKAPLAEHREAQPTESPTLAPLSLGEILRTQNVCAGSVPAGWIKINDAWNPTVCGNPTSITYNVWIIQQLYDQPVGAIIHACKATIPSGWAIVGTAWNPTVCGHPTTNQSNVMAIKRLS
jgi:hypothetical protein